VAPVAFNRAVLADRGGHHGRRPFALSAGAAESIETGEPVSRKRKSTDASYWLLATATWDGPAKGGEWHAEGWERWKRRTHIWA